MTPSKYLMRLSCRLVALLLWAAIAVYAAEFMVGDSEGWKTPTANDIKFYNNWSSNQNLRVNDTLRFKYTKNQHNVLVVKETDFDQCLNNTPFDTHEDGDTTIKLNRTGSWYFICGYPGHCKAGQALKAEVDTASLTNSTGGNNNSRATPQSTASFFTALVAAISGSIWISL